MYPSVTDIAKILSYIIAMRVEMTFFVILTLFYFTIRIIPEVSINCSNPTTVIQSDNFACECKGTDGNPPADVTWYKDNTLIGDSGEKKAISSLSNVDKDDDGTYKCEAKSGTEEAKNKTDRN